MLLLPVPSPKKKKKKKNKQKNKQTNIKFLILEKKQNIRCANSDPVWYLSEKWHTCIPAFTDRST